VQRRQTGCRSPIRPLAGILLALALLIGAPATAAADDRAEAQAKGLSLFRAGRYAEAKPHFAKAVDLGQAQDGPDAPSLAVDLNNLAETLRLTGELEAAERSFRRAIAIDERARGPDDPGLATSLNNLALVYRAQGRLDEAERLHTRSLAMLERALGPNHPDVARSLNNLAVLYVRQGKPEQARPLQERAVAIADRALGPQHPTTRTLRANLTAIPAAATAAAAPAARAAPARAPASAPPATAATGGRFGIHLESIRAADGVAAAWRALVAKHPSLARLQPRPAEAVEIPGKGRFYRVAAGDFPDRASAEAACRPIKATGAYCGILAP
jgi:tetratricopeptide (TPR) repeat protein